MCIQVKPIRYIRLKHLGHLLSVIKSVGKEAILTESVVLNKKSKNVKESVKHICHARMRESEYIKFKIYEDRIAYSESILTPLHPKS